VSAAPLLVLATGNAGKLVELRALLAELPLRVADLGDFPAVAFPEEGDDYAANAAAKARAAAQALGHPALADDSGIEVDGLGGAPGARSARYGGPALDDAGRTALLLRELAARPGADRRARFVCVAALALPGGALRTAFGSCQGRIAEAPRGRAGFGYDPVFVPDEQAAPARFTLAELGPEAKARISHRGGALRALLPAVSELVLGAAPQSPAAKRS
jgi:XTP/dITP diphosphohydrolase